LTKDELQMTNSTAAALLAATSLIAVSGAETARQFATFAAAPKALIERANAVVSPK
jgi:hypothetical protein